MNRQQAPINNTFIPKAIELAKDFNSKASCAWLSDYRQSQIALLEQASFPHKQVEHFKYNRLHGFDDKDFSSLTLEKPTLVANEFFMKDLDGNDNDNGKNDIETIVIIDGQFDSAQSVISKQKVTEFSQADSNQQSKILASLSAQSLENNPFILQNACLSDQGVYIEIEDTSPKPLIQVIDIITEKSVNKTVANQIVIDIADRCQATILTKNISVYQTAQTALSTKRIIANIGDSATLQHYHLALENTNSLHFANICYNLQDHSRINAFHAVTGGNLKKLDIQANHLGQHAHATLNGLYVATGEEQVDVHTEVNHPKPQGTTDENFRGLVNGNAEAVFNGRIHIYEDAQKTLAEMSNKNLILSDTAQLHTKPELEIYADDVVCAHGATVSRLQDTALSYLRARGINKAEAELMLSYAFFDELLGELEHEAVAEYIRPILFKSFE